MQVSNIGTGVIDCQVCVHANGKTSAHLKSVFTSQCLPCARMQSRRRGRHCLTASSMTTWWKCSHSLLQLVDATNLAAVHTLLQLPLNLVVDWVKVRTVGWPQSLSDSPVLHELTDALSRVLCGQSVVLPDCLTALQSGPQKTVPLYYCVLNATAFVYKYKMTYHINC